MASLSLWYHPYTMIFFFFSFLGCQRFIDKCKSSLWNIKTVKQFNSSKVGQKFGVVNTLLITIYECYRSAIQLADLNFLEGCQWKNSLTSQGLCLEVLKVKLRDLMFSISCNIFKHIFFKIIKKKSVLENGIGLIKGAALQGLYKRLICTSCILRACDSVLSLFWRIERGNFGSFVCF